MTFAWNLKMGNKNFYFFLILLIFLNSCSGTSSKGLFGTGVSVAIDPRSLGTQIDDSIMEKNLTTRLTMVEKKYFLSVQTFFGQKLLRHQLGQQRMNLRKEQAYYPH